MLCGLPGRQAFCLACHQRNALRNVLRYALGVKGYTPSYTPLCCRYGRTPHPRASRPVHGGLLPILWHTPPCQTAFNDFSIADGAHPCLALRSVVCGLWLDECPWGTAWGSSSPGEPLFGSFGEVRCCSRVRSEVIGCKQFHCLHKTCGENLIWGLRFPHVFIPESSFARAHGSEEIAVRQATSKFVG